MKTRKTSSNQRQTYTYHFDNGDKVIIEPGKSTTIYASGGSAVVIDETITDVTIKKLHSILLSLKPNGKRGKRSFIKTSTKWKP